MNLNDLNRAGYEECVAAGIACDVVLDDQTRERIARRIEGTTGERPECGGLSPEQRLAVDRAVDAALARQSAERGRAAADTCAKVLPGLGRFNAA